MMNITKITGALVLTVCTLLIISPAATAKDLGDVIRDGIRGEVRDTVRDSVRRDICDRRADRGRNTDLCDTFEDLDSLRDDLRRGRNAIRAIDAILD